jgi:hypothetical protein
MLKLNPRTERMGGLAQKVKMWSQSHLISYLVLFNKALKESITSHGYNTISSNKIRISSSKPNKINTREEF